jgi:GT2 family glycosyltransferase
MRRADVLIVTHQAGELLAKCLAAVRAQHCAPARIVVVVSSTAPVNLSHDIEVLRTPEPADFAPAANLGLRALGERPVVLLNDDTVPSPSFLGALLGAVDEPGIYQPQIHLEDGSIDNTGHWLFWDGFNVARDRGQMHSASPARCGAFSGAAVMFTPEVLAHVGHFDEDFGAYGEDLDLSLRAIRQGFPIHFVPEASITHTLGATYGRISPRKIFLVERNRTAAAIRSLPKRAVAVLPATSTLRISMMGAAALAGRGLGSGAGFSGAAAALAGVLAGFGTARSAWAKRQVDRGAWTTDGRSMWSHIQQSRAPLGKLMGIRITAP